MRPLRWLQTQIKKSEQCIWVKMIASLSKRFPHHQRNPVPWVFLITREINKTTVTNYAKLCQNNFKIIN